jgi:hypothetical protein
MCGVCGTYLLRELGGVVTGMRGSIWDSKEIADSKRSAKMDCR